MKKTLLILLVSLFAVDPAFCMARKDSKQQAISQGIYGASESIDKGRVDLADSLLNDTKRLVTPPRKPLKISEVNGKVILPEKLKGDSIKVASPEFQALERNKETKKAVKTGEKVKVSFAKSVDREIQRDVQADAKIKADLDKANKTIVEKDKKIKHLSGYRSLVWTTVLGIGALLAIYVLSLLARLGISAFRAF